MSQAVVVLVTVPDLETGVQIARKLVEERIAACVNILPSIHSIYTWEQKIEEQAEVLLLVKTRPELLEDRLIPAVRAAHPYQTPEIIALPVVKGLPAYLTWIEESTL